MAHLCDLPQLRCRTCHAPARVELVNAQNAVIGQFCRRCGREALRTQQRVERKAEPPGRQDATPSTPMPVFKEKRMTNNLFRNATRVGAPALAVLLSIVVLGCTDADVASRNLSKAADQFEITRRIVFYNGITGEYMLVIEGLCSLGNYDSARRLSVTCKAGPTKYKKHFLGLSDNVTFFVEQLESVAASPYRYRVIFKPDIILPDIDIATGIGGG